MCDTMAALSTRTANGNVLFAKNSDRSPNEPQQILRTFPVDYPDGARLECTYITIDQARHTNACMLCKPAWMWGCEMGANEFGLHIGNEAVFTKEPINKEGGLTGMDLVRIALERTATARAAVDLIISLIIRYGQGGDCGYDHPFYYHNSFLAADANEAWVLETAGEYWALKKVRDVYTISNALTIEDDYDEIHAGAMAHAIEKGWLKKGQPFRFATCYGDPLKTPFAQAKQRRALTMETLSKPNLTAQDLFGALRRHQPKARPFARGGCADVCMHYGIQPGSSHTTGSLAAEIGTGFSTEYVTGMSTPCTALFKPYWMQADTTQLVLPLYAARAAREAWLWREQLPRKVRRGEIAPEALAEYLQKRDALEDRLYRQSQALMQNRSAASVLSDAARRAVDKEIELLNEVLASPIPAKKRPQGGLFHIAKWGKMDAMLGVKRPEEV